ncbi:hypothetical protein D1872_253780 [compost metagenome]
MTALSIALFESSHNPFPIILYKYACISCFLYIIKYAPCRSALTFPLLRILGTFCITRFLTVKGIYKGLIAPVPPYIRYFSPAKLGMFAPVPRILGSTKVLTKTLFQKRNLERHSASQGYNLHYFCFYSYIST